MFNWLASLFKKKETLPRSSVITTPMKPNVCCKVKAKAKIDIKAKKPVIRKNEDISSRVDNSGNDLITNMMILDAMSPEVDGPSDHSSSYDGGSSYDSDGGFGD
jgi:hypothetical protein